MTSEKFGDRVEQLADEFEARGFLVTRQLEVEVRGAALFLSQTPATLRNTRCILAEDGPPCRVHAGRSWYAIAGLLQWVEAKQPDDGTVIDSDNSHEHSVRMLDTERLGDRPK